MHSRDKKVSQKKAYCKIYKKNFNAIEYFSIRVSKHNYTIDVIKLVHAGCWVITA